MDRKLFTEVEVAKIARDNGLGTVRFEMKVAQNTGQLFEVGYVQQSRGRALFCKSRSHHPGQFYLCNEFDGLGG